MTDRSPDGVFDAYGRYYDLLYGDKDYAAEVNYVADLLNTHGTGRNLLEFGSGTGRHGRLLAKRGYDVLGIERSAEMLARAEKSEGFRCIEGDAREVQLGRTFDAVLALFHVVSYQTTNASVSAVFDRAAEHLQPGGLFVFDVWYSPAVHAQKPLPRVKRLSNENLDIVRVADPTSFPNENRVDVGYTIFVTERAIGKVHEVSEVHSMRHFSLPEIELFAARSGFQRVAAEGFLTGDPPGESTWGLCVVLRKT